MRGTSTAPLAILALLTGGEVVRLPVKVMRGVQRGKDLLFGAVACLQSGR